MADQPVPSYIQNKKKWKQQRENTRRAQQPRMPDEGERPSKKHVETPKETASRIHKNTLAMQKFLVDKGYNIVADGQLGQQTKSAAANWRGQRTPNKWNQRFAPIESSDRGSSPPNPETNQVNQPNDSPNTRSSPKRGKKKPTPVKVRGMSRGLSSNNEFLNPDLYARASVDAKYGPVIAELERQQKATNIEGAREVTQIGNWWEESAVGEQERATEVNTSNDAAVAQMLGLGGGLASALGVGADDPAVRSAVAGATALQVGLLQNVAANSRTQGAAAPGFARQSGAAGQAVSRRSTKERFDELGGELVEQRSARGNELIERRNDARMLNEQIKGERFKNQIALMNAQLAAATAPLEQQGAMLGIQRQIMALQQGQLGMQGQRLSNQGAAKRNALIGKPPPARPGEKPRRNFVQLNPEERSSLNESLMERLAPLLIPNDAGKTATIPRIVGALNAQLKNYGYKPGKNRQVGQFALGILAQLGIKGDPRWYGLGKR